MIGDDQAFLSAIEKAVPYAEDGGIVTFGIKPTGPNTQYGYIEMDGEGSNAPAVPIVRFVEKPTADAAEALLNSGHCVWNAGIFLMKASTLLEEMARYFCEAVSKGLRAKGSVRMRRCSGSLILICGLVSSTNAQAEVLRPTANWVVDCRDDQCLASRDYGSADKPVTLGIRPAPNGESYELLVARPRSGPDFATELKGSVDFGNGPIKAWILNYAGKTSKMNVFQFRISATEMEQAKSATSVTFRPQGAPDMSFALRTIPALLKGLQDCTADLKLYWNMDGEKNGHIKTPAKGDVRGVFDGDDYPGEALDRHQEGGSRFLLLVDEKGSVAGCHVLQPSGVPILDAMGCQVIRQRAKFKPARDPQGKPVRSTVATPEVTWRIEG
jgi:TonB family protein